MAYRIAALLITISAAVGGCARAAEEFIVPAGHPADPAARSGTVLSSSDALRPELKTVKAKVTPSATPQAPSQPATRHKH